MADEVGEDAAGDQMIDSIFRLFNDIGTVIGLIAFEGFPDLSAGTFHVVFRDEVGTAGPHDLGSHVTIGGIHYLAGG